MIINKLYENIVVYLGFPRSIIVVYSEPCDAEMLFYLFATEGLYILGFLSRILMIGFKELKHCDILNKPKHTIT